MYLPVLWHSWLEDPPFMKCHECKFDVNLKSIQFAASYVRPPEGVVSNMHVLFLTWNMGRWSNVICAYSKNWIWSDSPCTYSSNRCAEEPPHIDIVDWEDPTLVDMINLLWCECAVFYLHQSNHPKNRSLKQKLRVWKKRSLSSQGPKKCYVFISGTGSCLFVLDR